MDGCALQTLLRTYTKRTTLQVADAQATTIIEPRIQPWCVH